MGNSQVQKALKERFRDTIWDIGYISLIDGEDPPKERSTKEKNVQTYNAKIIIELVC